MHIKFLKYILLPSGNIYKTESWCLFEKLEDFIEKSKTNTIAILLYSEPKLFIFNESLFNEAICKEVDMNIIPEIIMLMKKIENSDGTIINI